MKRSIRTACPPSRARHRNALPARDRSIECEGEGTGLTVVRWCTRSAGGTPVSLYRIDQMPNKQKLYKIDINAQQNHLTGVALLTEKCNLVCRAVNQLAIS